MSGAACQVDKEGRRRRAAPVAWPPVFIRLAVWRRSLLRQCANALQPATLTWQQQAPTPFAGKRRCRRRSARHLLPRAG